MLKFARAAILSAHRADDAAGLRRTAHRADFSHVPKRKGYIYVRSRAISSRANDNHDLFPAEEIKAAYKTFIGKPVFVNHANENHKRARGVIKAAALHEDVNPDGTPDTWVEVLMEVDAVRFPKLAQAILNGDIDKTSMGTDVRMSRCSACGNEAETPLSYCDHIKYHKGATVSRLDPLTGKREDVKVVEICEGLGFFENSLLVEDPADPTAYFLGVEAILEEGQEAPVLATAASRSTPAPRTPTGTRRVARKASVGKVAHKPTVKGDLVAWPTPEGWRLGTITRNSGGTPTHAIEIGQSKSSRVAEGYRVFYRGWITDGSLAEMVVAYRGPYPSQDALVGFALPYTIMQRNDGGNQHNYDHLMDAGTRKIVDRQYPGRYSSMVGHSPSSLMASRFEWLRLGKTVDKEDVATMIDTLAGLLHDSEFANIDDLCQVSVPGTNLFCDQSKNVPRSQMPQLSDGSKDITEDFKKHLRDELGKSVTETTERAADLKATQNQLNGKKVAGMVQAIKSGSMKDEAIMVSSDNYIVDGHHRWAAKVAYDLLDEKLGDVTMPVSKVSMPILDLIDEANEFAADNGIAQRSIYAKKANNHGVVWRTSTGMVHRSVACPHLAWDTVEPVAVQSTVDLDVIAAFGKKACSTCFPGAPGRRAVARKRTAAQGRISGKQLRVGDIIVAHTDRATITSIEENVPHRAQADGSVSTGRRLHLSPPLGSFSSITVAPDEGWIVADRGSRRDLTVDAPPPAQTHVDLYCPLCSRSFRVQVGRGKLPRHNLGGSVCDGSGKTTDEAYALHQDLLARQRWGSKTAAWRQIDGNEWGWDVEDSPNMLSAWVGLVDGAWWWEIESIDSTGQVQVLDIGGPVPTRDRAQFLAERSLMGHTQRVPIAASKVADRTRVPSQVDTLRDEACPVCGNSDTFSGTECRVCGYRAVPGAFLDPNLDKAKEVADHQAEVDAEMEDGSLECDSCGESFAGRAGGGLERFKVSALDPDPDSADSFPSRYYVEGDSCPECGRGTLYPVGARTTTTEGAEDSPDE